MVTHCHGSSLPLFARFCRPILSTKHDSAVYPIDEVEYKEFKAFNKKVTQMFDILTSVESGELLSVSWISKLLDGFLSCQEQFRVLLSKNKACLSKHGLEMSLSDYFERSVKSLDVCNAIRDGIEEMMQWRNQLEIVFCALNSQKTIGEAQFRRAKRALNGLEMKINDGKESGSKLAHSKSFTWSVSRSWSASKQLQVIRKNIMLPKRSENIATKGLVSAIYTMNHLLHFVMWTLVAALPCQGRGLQSPFGVCNNFAWKDSILSIQERILNEYKKRDRRNSCGLLKEIHGIGKYTRYMNGLTNSTRFLLEDKQEGEMKKRIEKLGIVHKSLKNGLDPLQRRLREVFLGIVRCRMEELDVFARPQEGLIPKKYIKRKMMGGHRQDKLHKVDQKVHKELEKDKFDGDDKDTDVGDEFCTNLNHNSLELFELAVQNKDTEKDVEVEDVGENECVFLATQVRVAAEKQEAEIRRLSAQREERARVLKEDERSAKIRNQILKAPHIKLPLQNYGSKKSQYKQVPRQEITEVDTNVKVPTVDELKRTNSSLSPYKLKKCRDLKPWEEDLNRPSKRNDKVFVHPELEAYLKSSCKPRCQFPWCDDIAVDHLFWDSFVGMDDTREGWFCDEHIELWVMYLWHFRPSFADWSLVSSYFLTLLLHGTLPLSYANDEVYKLAWSDVDRVFIPINEPKKHWSVAQFHIQSGNVIFYDSLYRCEEEGRDWYLQMRNCLEVKLPLILQKTGVFAKKRIDPKTYKIKFHLAQNVPKHGGVFGDCGVFVCMFLYRLAHGIPLDVDNPTQAALAYREGLIRYYFKHRINCA